MVFEKERRKYCRKYTGSHGGNHTCCSIPCHYLWCVRQVAREYLLIMETEGYLKLEDQEGLISELEGYGLYNISLSGTTTSEVSYGDRIYLSIRGTYDDNILAFVDGISRVASNPVTVTIHRQTTAKQ